MLTDCWDTLMSVFGTNDRNEPNDLTDEPTNRPTNRPYQPTDQPTDQPTVLAVPTNRLGTRKLRNQYFLTFLGDLTDRTYHPLSNAQAWDEHSLFF